MIRFLVAALALAGGTLVPTVPVSAQGGEPEATGWYDGPCTDNVGVTIVVDFQELGGGVNVRCAPGPVTSGLNALDRADIAWEGTRRFSGAVCRIAGLPGPDAEACINTPPASAYWSYWLAPRGGDWCYSTVGAGSRVPPPGSIEGWSFSLDKFGAATPTPRFDPPPAIDGQPPNPIAPGECGAAVPAATTTTVPTTAPPVTTTTVAPRDPAPPETTPAPTTVARTGGTRTTTAAPLAATPTVAGSTAPSTSSSISNSTSSTSTTSTTSTTSSSPSTSSSTSTSTSTTTPSASASSTSVVPLGTVDLSDDQRGGGGFGAATAAGIVSVAGLAGTGIWIARRRRIAA